MQFNVAQLLKEPMGASREYALEERFPPLEDSGVESFQGELTFIRTDKGVWVHGSLKTGTRKVCSRCLAEFWHPIKLQFDEEYLTTVDMATGETVPALDPAEGYFTIPQNHILDLREAVRQHCITNQPMKPLCREECQGFCPTCGVNLNEGTCQCSGPSGDPRWAALFSTSSVKKARR